MIIRPTSLPDVLVLVSKRFGDSRGFFSESWNQREMLNAGLDVTFVHDNHSMSQEVKTLRGLHFHSPTKNETGNWIIISRSGTKETISCPYRN